MRGYELDMNGHLNQAVYLQYGEHARWECLRAAGVLVNDMLADDIGLVVLESTIRYRSELRDGHEVDVTCAFVWGEGRTFRIEQQLRRTDGVVAAEISSVMGLLSLSERRLVPSPAERWRALAATPARLGL